MPDGDRRRGQIVGYYTQDPRRRAARLPSGFLLDHLGWHTFPSSGQAHGVSGDTLVGTLYGGGHRRQGFVERHGVRTELNIPSRLYDNDAWAINGHGEVIGTYTDAQDHTHGYLLRPS